MSAQVGEKHVLMVSGSLKLIIRHSLNTTNQCRVKFLFHCEAGKQTLLLQESAGFKQH